MAQNRTIPYGYQIRNGSVILHEEESEIVRRIYYDYAGGKSYKVIADSLTLEGVRYMPDKPAWNKNMVARILQNKNYNGSGKYPSIVTENMSRTTTLVKKSVCLTQPKALKDIKPLLKCGICGGKVCRQTDKRLSRQWYCENDIKHIAAELTDEMLIELLKTLQRHLGTCTIAPPEKSKALSFEVANLQNEIARLLTTAGESISEIQSKLLELASLKYTLCEDTHHIEQSLLEKLCETPDTLQPKLLTQLADHIQLVHTQITGITLKNGCTIQRGETHG